MSVHTSVNAASTSACATRFRNGWDRPLVSEQLKTIAEWKRTFDNGGAWDKTVEAERAIVEHCEKHGCQEAHRFSGLPAAAAVAGPSF
jgi:hypothetical protein